MPGKQTDGFTKSAQQNKFIRHRDVKLKESEVEKEAKIQRSMCDGVCPRCREKVQWRFKYDKYKPLKSVATCQGCRQKCVTKAYRTFCDKCAADRGVCSSCCRNMSEAISERETRDEQILEKQENAKRNELETDDMIIVQDEDCDNPRKINKLDNSIIMIDKDDKIISSILKSGTSDWDSSKFANVASHKYGKNRVVGSVEDTTIFVFPTVSESDVEHLNTTAK